MQAFYPINKSVPIYFSSINFFNYKNKVPSTHFVHILIPTRYTTIFQIQMHKFRFMY